MHSRGPDRRRVQRHGQEPAPPASGERRKSTDRRSNGFISGLDLFTAIPYQAVEAVLAECSEQNANAGTVLLRPGERNHAVYLLISGRLRVHLDSADSADYITIEAGGCFGELSVIDGLPVSAFVVADQPSRLLCITEQVFWEGLITQPGVARNLLTTLSERMRSNRDLILERAQDRLALEHLQRELAIAQDIQRSMLPDGAHLLAGRRDVEVFALMEPAKDVGGDFYDAFFVAPGRLFIAVGDVSGKGVPAALYMARTITQLRLEAARRKSPSATLNAVNRALCLGNDAAMFVSLFCGLLDTATGQFSYANAGHNPPVFLDGSGHASFLSVRAGIVAGVMDGARYPAGSLRFSPGQALFLYTDGVTEALDPDQALYSDERLLADLGGISWQHTSEVVQHAGEVVQHARVLVQHVRRRVAEFAHGAAQADDITILAVHYQGGAEELDSTLAAE